MICEWDNETCGKIKGEQWGKKVSERKNLVQFTTCGKFYTYIVVLIYELLFDI